VPAVRKFNAFRRKDDRGFVQTRAIVGNRQFVAALDELGNEITGLFMCPGGIVLSGDGLRILAAGKGVAFSIDSHYPVFVVERHRLSETDENLLA